LSAYIIDLNTLSLLQWITLPGFPALFVSLESSDRLSVRQRRFVADGSSGHSGVWPVSLAVSCGTAGTAAAVIDTESAVVALPKVET
jgi:aminopeptidase N